MLGDIIHGSTIYEVRHKTSIPVLLGRAMWHARCKLAHHMDNPATVHDAAARAHAPSPVVLVAEDDAAFRHLLASVLREAGYHVLEARNGMEILDLVGPRADLTSGAVRPDLLIADVRMPGLSGLRALAALRQTGRSIPFIVITAFGSHDTHVAARALGAVAVFDKPFPLSELRREVARQLPLAPARPA